MIDHFLGPLMRGPDKLPPRWLMMMDTDMTFESWAIHKLLAVAEHEDIKVIGGLCFAGGLSKMYPTVYSLQRDEHGPYTEVVPDYPRDQLVKVGATGGAFLLVHRDVFLRMLEQHGKLPDGRPNPKPWFVDAEHNGRDLGEDIAFCLRAQALGYGVYVHTGVKVGHIKRYELDEEEWDRRRAGDSKAGHLEVAG
jgi:GT2 family glycosyltransferase